MSKYYPVNNEEDYTYFVEGRNPHEKHTGANSRWSRNINLSPQQYHRNFYTPGVIYCNPKFSPESSQATLPYESESDDPYSRRRYAVYSTMGVPKCPSYVRASNVGTYRVSKSMISEEPPMYYHYGDIPRRTYERARYHEVVPEEELSVDDESEPEPRKILKPPKNVTHGNEKSSNLRSTYSMEKIKRNLNNFNKHNVGCRKLNSQEVHMITERLRSRQRLDHHYLCNRSRFLNKSYEHTAKVLKEAQTKAILKQSRKPSELYSLKRLPSETPINSHLKIDGRQMAVASDRHGHVFVGSQKLVQQVSSQFVIVNRPVPEECDRYSPIPEEQQETSGGSEEKPTDVEQPVKLQKEDSTPAEFTVMNEITQKNPSQTRKARGSITRTGRRNRRLRKYPVGGGAYTKIVQKFVEETQANIIRKSETAKTKIDLPPQPNSSNQVASPSTKSSLKIEISDMLSKLEEIQNLLNKKKDAPKEEVKTVQKCPDLTGNATGPNSSSAFSSEVAMSCKSNESSRHVSPIYESDGVGDKEHRIKESHRDPTSILSTQSVIMSHLSNLTQKLVSNKSYDNEDTEAQIFQDVFQSEEEVKTKHKSKIPLIKKRQEQTVNKAQDLEIASVSSASTVYQLPRGALQIPKDSSASIVTVFPVLLKTTENRQGSLTVRKRRISKKRTSLKTIQDDEISNSSSDNLDGIKIHRRKPRREISITTSIGNNIRSSSVYHSLNNALQIILDFFFKYFRSLFIF